MVLSGQDLSDAGVRGLRLFGRSAPSAMFLLGAGEDCPGLHNPDDDFPDALIAIGARVFMRTLREIRG